jgi:F0F1-type ATP synthase assembly protein I
MAKRPDDEKQPSAPVVWARYSQLAFILPAAVVVGLLLGKLGDHVFHTRWLFLVGIIVGAIAGFTDMIRTITKDKG